MLHMGKNSGACKKCIPLWGFKITTIVIVGSIIGYCATDFAQEPFSTRLILNKTHNDNTNNMVTILDTMASDIVLIKEDIAYIKNEIYIKNNTRKDSEEK